MRRPPPRRLAAGIVAAGAVLAAAVLVGVLALRWSGGEGGSYAPPEPVASGTIEPPGALFGDVLTATASVLVDTREIDPSTVQVYGRFAPYRVVSRSRSVVRGVGRAARVDQVFRLQCLTAACLDRMERTRRNGRVVPTPIRFGAARFVAGTRAGGERRGPVRWPPVLVRSRLSPADLAAETLPTPPFVALEPSYRLPPDAVAWALIVIAVALTLAGGALIATPLRGAAVVRRLRIPGHLSGIDRALALARHAAAEGDTAGERRALERLAAELRRRGDGELAVAARRLAWSEGDPTGDALEELAGEVARMGNGR